MASPKSMTSHQKDKLYSVTKREKTWGAILGKYYVPSFAHDKKAEMKSNKGHCTCRKRACPVKQSSRPSTYYVSKDVGGLGQK